MSPLLVAIIAILIAIACIVLAFRYGKIFFKVFGVFFLVVFVLFMVYAALVVNDSIQLNKGLTEDNNLYVFVDEDELLSAFILKNTYKRTAADVYQETIFNRSSDEQKKIGELTTGEQEAEVDMPFTFIDETEFTRLKTDYIVGDFDAMLGDDFKVFFFNKYLFDDRLKQIISFENYEMTIEEAIQILKAENPTNTFIERLSAKNSLSTQEIQLLLSKYNQDLRGEIFVVMLATIMGDDFKSTTKLISLINRDKLSVYPNTIMFKALKPLPQVYANDFISSMERLQ